MTLSSAYIELFIRGEKSRGNVRGEMSGYRNLPRFSSTKASFCKLILLTLNNINKYQILYLCFVITIVYYLNLLIFTFKQALRFMVITLDLPTTIEATMPE